MPLLAPPPLTPPKVPPLVLSPQAPPSRPRPDRGGTAEPLPPLSLFPAPQLLKAPLLAFRPFTFRFFPWRGRPRRRLRTRADGEGSSRAGRWPHFLRQNDSDVQTATRGGGAGCWHVQTHKCSLGQPPEAVCPRAYTGVDALDREGLSGGVVHDVEILALPSSDERRLELLHTRPIYNRLARGDAV